MTRQQMRAVVSLVALVVGVLIVVPIIHGVHPNGSLGLGDGIVGAGTLLLAAGTGVLAMATFRVDKRAAEREEAQMTARLRGVSRLILAELQVVQASLEQDRSNGWDSHAPLPHEGWSRNAEDLLSALNQPDARALVEFFSRLESWEHRVDLLLQSAPRIKAFPFEQLGGTGTIDELIRTLGQVNNILSGLSTDVPLKWDGKPREADSAYKPD